MEEYFGCRSHLTLKRKTGFFNRNLPSLTDPCWPAKKSQSAGACGGSIGGGKATMGLTEAQGVASRL